MLVDKFLYGQVENPHRLKELKVKIPLHYHMRLHGLKILGEDSISATVEKALELYFQRLGATDVVGANAPAPAAAASGDGSAAASGHRASETASGAGAAANAASAPGHYGVGTGAAAGANAPSGGSEPRA